MLANGRPYLAIPGPSVMPDEVLRAMHRAAPNIYEGELHDVTKSLFPDLKRLARTTGGAAIYIGNGHAAWEAALANVVAPGETVLVLATGRFCLGWGEMAKAMGIGVEVVDFGMQSDIDADRAETALRADKEHRIKAVLAVHVDTSTSVLNDIAGVRAAMDAAGHPALLMADCIASFGCDRFEMDAWGVDVMVTACQKGLMTPPGLGLVFANDRARAVRDTMARVSMYWDWRRRMDPAEYYQYFAGTAPTHHIYGLRAALDMIHAEGVEAVWARHAQLARAIWVAVETWGAGGAMRLNIGDAAKRATGVTAIELGGNDGARLRSWVEHNAGVTLGIGLGRTPTEAFFRIGHMGHVNAQMVMGSLGAIDSGLKAEGIAHGHGALDAASAVIAGR